jgi:hypothetical protein
MLSFVSVQQSAFSHQPEKDWWVLSHMSDINRFSFLLKADG